MEKLLNNTYTRVISLTVKSYEWVDTSNSTSQFLTLKRRRRRRARTKPRGRATRFPSLSSKRWEECKRFRNLLNGKEVVLAMDLQSWIYHPFTIKSQVKLGLPCFGWCIQWLKWNLDNLDLSRSSMGGNLEILSAVTQVNGVVCS